MTAREWSVKLKKHYSCVQQAFAKKGVERAMADWQEWDNMGLESGRQADSIDLRKQMAGKKASKANKEKCLCLCPRCRKERKELSTFQRQLDPPPKINRVYCRECAGAASRASSSITIAGVSI